MKKAVTASLLFLSSFLLVGVRSSPGVPSGDPLLEVDSCTVDPGGDLSGMATDCDLPITVEALHDGHHLDGSPDLGGFGETRNPFSFPVPNDAEGTITVIASDGLGNETTKIVTIN